MLRSVDNNLQIGQAMDLARKAKRRLSQDMSNDYGEDNFQVGDYHVSFQQMGRYFRAQIERPDYRKQREELLKEMGEEADGDAE